MITLKDTNRFHSKYIISPKDCWEWQDSLDRDGYGSFFLMGFLRRAHRVSWLLHRGAIPKGLVVGHTCRNRKCVNPQHLQAITSRENNLKNSDSIPAINAQKTHCKNGHPFNKTYKAKNGVVRYCSICQSEKQKKLRASRIDLLADVI